MGKKFTLVVAAAILIAVGIYTVNKKTQDSQPEEKIFSPREAIPSVDGSQGYIFLEAEDTGAIAYTSSLLARALSAELPPLPGLNLPVPDNTAGALGLIEGFAGASKSIAACAASGDAEKVYVSMFVDDEKFDALIKSADSSVMGVREWAERGGDAWILSVPPDAESDDLLYVTRRRVGGESLVSVADSAESIDAMAAAVSDPALRASVGRATELPNFVRVKHGGQADAEADGPKIGEAEAAWSRTDEKISIQWFSDLYAGAADRIASLDFSPAPMPIFGDGQVAAAASINPAYFISATMPDEEDPVKAFVARWGKGLPSNWAEDFESILKRCRISAAVVTSADAVSAAYLTLESADSGAVGGMYGLASLYFGAGKKLDGWDSMFQIPIPSSPENEINAFAAQRDGTVLLGVGDLGQYAVSADAGEEILRVTSPPAAFGFEVRPDLLKVREGAIGRLAAAELSSMMNRYSALAGFSDAAELDGIERVSLRQSMDGRVDIDIFLRK